MKIIFDLDHTLYNMSEMHKALIEEVCKLGITEEQYNYAYDDVTRWKQFTVEAFAQRLNKMYGLDINKVKKALHKVVDCADLFMYEDSINVLGQLKEKGHELHLLSFGDKEWQQKKVDKCEINHLFVNVVIGMEEKNDYKFKFSKDEEVVVIDDMPNELELWREVIPEIKCIRLRRENGKYSDVETPFGMHEAINLKDVCKIISECK